MQTEKSKRKKTTTRRKQQHKKKKQMKMKVKKRGSVLKDIISKKEFLHIYHILQSKYTLFLSYTQINSYEIELISKKMNDNNRFDSLGEGFLIGKKRETKKLIHDFIHWINKNCWEKRIIHGDLTTNNIIYENNTLYIIDWFDTMQTFPEITFKALYYTLLDIFDVFSSLAYALGNNWRDDKNITSVSDYHFIVKHKNKTYNVFSLFITHIKNNEGNCNDDSDDDFQRILNNQEVDIIFYWLKINALLQY